MMRMFAVAVVGGLCILFALPEVAVADEWEDCVRLDGAEQVVACNQVLAIPGLSLRNRGLAFYNRARGNLGQEFFKSATTDFSRAIRDLGEDYLAYFGRGVAYVHRQEYSNAVRDFSKVIELNPDHVKAYYNRAFVYEQLGENELAIEDHREVLRRDPTVERSQEAIERLS